MVKDVNSSGLALLNDPHPCGHIVYPYTDESHFTEVVSVFVSSGLRNGESAVLLMQESHRGPIRRQLERNGFDVETLEATGELACITAEELSESCVFDGIIDEYVFKTKIGQMIHRAKAASLKGQVRVFGEMVNLLWMPNPKATLRLEELWNDLIKQHSVPLLCAYALGGTRPDVLDDALLACHSAVAA
jgi:hypothetical protein